MDSASHVLATQIYSELVKVAMMGTTITWSDLTEALNLPQRGESMTDAMNSALFNICKFDISNGRAPITAVLLANNKRVGRQPAPKMPGTGYFSCLKQLGIIDNLDEVNRVEVWTAQLRMVYVSWDLTSSETPAPLSIQPKRSQLSQDNKSN